jgi:hypothetical protein
MAELSYSCDVSQAFNFQKDAQSMVGHINKLKVSTKDLAVDLEVTDPEDVAGDKVKVVGVVSSMYWAGGFADPIQFGCQVSNANKKTLQVLSHSEMSDTTVQFSFTIYDYDPDEKKYYQAFHTKDEVLKGLVEKSGGQLSIEIDSQQSEEVVSPKNFAFSLGVMPEDIKQPTHMAMSVSDKLVKEWGVTVAA